MELDVDNSIYVSGQRPALPFDVPFGQNGDYPVGNAR